MDPEMKTAVEIQEGVPLARLTTVGIGGPARYFARAADARGARGGRRLGGGRGMPIVTIGLGSNVLAADAGVDALVVRLAGELAAVEIRGECSSRAVAPRTPSASTASRAGLGGIEFACAIPGTAGGGVRMNAGAYGSDWSAIVARARRRSCGSRLAHARRSSSSPTGTRRSGGAGRRRVEFGLTPRPARDVKRTVAELNAPRKATQPTNKRTFGSVFKNPAHELGAGKMLDACGLKGYRIGGAQISPGTRTSSRTPATRRRPTHWR